MKVGDIVEVLDEPIKGHITGVQGDNILIEAEDGFVFEFHRSQLVVIDGKIDDKALINSDIEEKIAQELASKKSKNSTQKKNQKEKPAMEVDLHIWKLVDKTKGLTNFEMLNIQLETAKRQLEFAIRKRIQRIVFIHGVGEGVLKAELVTLFNRYEGLKWYDADFRKYGVGATEVYIFQNTAR